VKFLGAQDDSTVIAFMQKSNLFISTSFMETFGMSIQEAAITGLPLLVLEGGNAANHVRAGQNGWHAVDMASLVRIFEQLVDKPVSLDEMTKKAATVNHTYPTSWIGSARAIIEFISGLD
jgi:glycosyltransferase involved in cell wall biosynthesis